MFYWHGGGVVCVGLMGSGGTEMSLYVGNCSDDMSCKGGTVGLVA